MDEHLRTLSHHLIFAFILLFVVAQADATLSSINGIQFLYFYLSCENMPSRVSLLRKSAHAFVCVCMHVSSSPAWGGSAKYEFDQICESGEGSGEQLPNPNIIVT